jgi:molybdate transport system regulatory protein
MVSALIKAVLLKTSARNQFSGKVTAVREGAVNADVVLSLGDGMEIFANITNDAVRDLNLRPGRDAVALIKANFVTLSPSLDERFSARNKFRGQVTRILIGRVNSEIKLKLPAGRTITAIVNNEELGELRIVEGDRCTALVKASHVLIGVED